MTKRVGAFSAFRGCGRAALAGAALLVLLGARSAQAELVLEFLDGGGSPIHVDSEESFGLLNFRVRMVDNGLPPAPSTTLLSFSKTLDRTTLDGVPEADRFWTFTLNASANYVTNPDGSLAGVQDSRFFLFGQHLKGHAGTVNPNGLELISTDPAISENAGNDFRFMTFKEVKHPHTDGTHGIDQYGTWGEFKVGDSPLSPLVVSDFPLMSGQLHVRALHIDAEEPSAGMPPKKTSMTFGSSDSRVAFHAGIGPMGAIELFTGQNDTALRQPPSPGGPMVDPEFAGDPLLNTSFTEIFSLGFTLVPYLGFDADRGLYKLGGGTATVQNFGTGDYTLTAAFDEMLYDPNAGDFYGLMNRVNFTDLINSPPSEFLAEFVLAHLLGGDPTSRGIMFTFNMPGLAEATNGFTTSYSPTDPVGMYMTGILVPEPSSITLLSFGSISVVLIAVHHRRSNRR
jgi:hypothetical protein